MEWYLSRECSRSCNYISVCNEGCGVREWSSDCLDAERREEESLWQHVRPSSLIWITVSSPARTPIITLFCIGLKPPGAEEIRDVCAGKRC